MNTDQRTLEYYLEELGYLQEQGREFARRYPAIGARLDLTSGRPGDPHVERLIESFAFLTARLQRQIDADFPQISSAMLGQLYPQLTTIVPPLTIACFEADLDHGKWTTGYRIDAGTALLARGRDEAPCRFRTCYPVTLWPVEVVQADFESPDAGVWPGEVAAVLRVRLDCASPGFQALGMGTLRFYLDGHAEKTGVLYDMFATQVAGIAWADGNRVWRVEPAALRPVGFDAADEVLPYPAPAHAGYRLLQEYFHFPQKYFFFDVDLPREVGAGSSLDLLILLREAPAGLRVSAANFRLGCTPAINLFLRSSEPLRVDHRRHEYRLVADYRREAGTEIHSILGVSDSVNPAAAVRRVAPLYSLRQDACEEARAFWHARRVHRDRDGLPGTDVYLSFVDRDFSPAQAPASTVFAQLLCTNRTLAAELPAGTAFSTDQAVPARSIRCLDKPTPPGYPPLDGATQWPLVSSLSLNHLSLGGPQGLVALREILRLYCPEDRPAARRQIEGIRSVECRPVVRHIGRDAWRGHRHGTEVTIVFNTEERHYVAASAALLASVLRHFFALHTAVNSFVEVVVRREPREEDWLRLPALSGSQAIL